MNKLILTDKDLKKLVSNICRELAVENWKPDYIVGITRGGLVSAVMISHYLGVPMKSLDVSLRDGGDCASNCGMAEDALGYPKAEKYVEDSEDVGAILDAAGQLLEEGSSFKHILIVDDINDTGATFNWIMKDWQSSCLPNNDDWKWVWNNNVRFAVLVDNLASHCEVKMDYAGMEVNKAENDVWIEFPYEEWWAK